MSENRYPSHVQAAARAYLQAHLDETAARDEARRIREQVERLVRATADEVEVASKSLQALCGVANGERAILLVDEHVIHVDSMAVSVSRLTDPADFPTEAEAAGEVA